MKIGFVTDTISQEMTGVGRYATNMFRHLQLAGNTIAPIDWRQWKSIGISPIQQSSSFIPIPNLWPIAKTLLWHSCLLRKLKSEQHLIDLLFSPSQFLHPLGRLDIPFVYVVHDVSFMAFPDCHKAGRKIIFSVFLGHTLRKANHIVCDSEYTRSQLLKYFKVDSKKASVIYGAAESCFKPISNAKRLKQIQQKYALPKEFILYVGTIEPRKNLSNVFKGYHLLSKNIPFPLIVAGKLGWRSRPILELHEGLGLADRVRFLGFVPDTDLVALYNLASALVYVSKDEGFGLPPLEAMQCGLPVVFSNAGSLPEVVGEGGMMVSSDDPLEIGRAILHICTDKPLREKLKLQGLKRSADFSWENAAKELTEIFQRLVNT